MQEKLQNFFTNITTGVSGKWNSLEKQQKTRLIAGVLVLVIAIGLTLFLTLRPKYSVIVSKEDLRTVDQVVTALNNAGIKNKVIENGRSVQIQDKDVYEARIAIEVHTDAEPIVDYEDEFTINDMFNNTGIGVSESVKKEMSRVAVENKLAGIIRKMEGISDAIVVLDMPEKTSLFVKDTELAKASVFITEKVPLTPEQATTVANTVVAGVKGLSIDRIVITNQHKVTLFPVAEVVETEGERLNTAYEREEKLRREMQANIYTLLEPMFDEVKVNLNITLDNNKIKEEELQYYQANDETNSGVLENRKTNSESAQGTGDYAGNEPGVYANDGTSDSYQAGGQGGSQMTANSKGSEENYKVSEKKTTREFSTGDLVRDESSVAITVYNYKTINEKQMRENGLLDDISWYQYKMDTKSKMIDIDNYDYLLESLRRGTGLENLTLVGYEIYNFVDEIKAPVDYQQILIFVILALLILMLAFGLLRRNKEEIEDVIVVAEPELAVEDLLVSTQLEEEIEEEAEKLQEIDYTVESEVKIQITKFVEEKPEAVAQLLRNWLQESWE